MTGTKRRVLNSRALVFSFCNPGWTGSLAEVSTRLQKPLKIDDVMEALFPG